MGKYSAIVQAISDRLDGHAVSGGILDGFRIKATPEKEVLGEQDVKVVAMMIPDIEERWVGQDDGMTTLTLNLVVSTRRKDGPVVHVQAVEALLDALERTPGGAYTPTLGGLLREPYGASIGNQVLLQLSLNTEISMSCQPKYFPRQGGRR